MNAKRKLHIVLQVFLAIALVAGCRAPGFALATPTQPSPTQAESTSTPLPTATYTPSPTATPAPPSMKVFTGAGFEITLADTYQGGSSTEEIQSIIDTLHNGGSDALAQIAEENKGSFRFFAVDNRQSLVFRTSVNIIAMQNGLFIFAPASVIAQTLKTQLPDLLPGAEIIEEGSFEHPSLDSYYLVYLVDSPDLGFDEEMTSAIVQYLFHDGDFVWVLSFSVPQSEIDSRMDEFNASAVSFRTTD